MSFVTNTSYANARLEANTGFAPPQAGALGGERVQAKDLQSILSDAREEIGMIVGEKIEARNHEKLEIGAEERAPDMKIEAINAYLEAVRHENSADEIASIVRRLRTSPHPRLAAGRESSRPGTQYALLQRAAQEASVDRVAEEVERLQDALADLYRDRRDEIHADLNSAEAGSEFAPTTQGVAAYQAAYCDIVFGKGTLADTLTLVLRRLVGLEGKDFGEALKSLLHALGADLRATRPSTGSIRLQALIQDIYHLEVAGTVLETCVKLSFELASRFQLTGVVPKELMQDLVAMTNDRWLTPQRLRELAAKFGVQVLLARIAFHSGTKNALSKMPVKVFPDAEVRRAMLDTAQQVLDDAVTEEEDAQGS